MRPSCTDLTAFHVCKLRDGRLCAASVHNMTRTLVNGEFQYRFTSLWGWTKALTFAYARTPNANQTTVAYGPLVVPAKYCGRLCRYTGDSDDLRDIVAIKRCKSIGEAITYALDCVEPDSWDWQESPDDFAEEQKAKEEIASLLLQLDAVGGRIKALKGYLER